MICDALAGMLSSWALTPEILIAATISPALFRTGSPMHRISNPIPHFLSLIHAKPHIGNERYIKAFDSDVLAAMERMQTVVSGLGQPWPAVGQRQN